jgi:hypothetical protein
MMTFFSLWLQCLLVLATRNFREEPNAALGLVDPDFDEAGGGDIIMLSAELVRLAHEFDQLLIVGGQLEDYVNGRDGRFIVVFQALVAGDVADGAERETAEFSGALGDVVGHGENLLTLLVEKKVIVAEMAAGHVPVEIFRLQIESEDVGEKLAKVGGDGGDGVTAQVAGLAMDDPVSWFAGHGFSFH